MIAQRSPAVLGTKSSPALQDWHDMVDKPRQLVRQRRSHEGESVDGAGVLPSDHVIGELLGCSDEVRLACAFAQPLCDRT
jgi:hypothetical protein